jgi:hypothetical protein
MRRKELPLQEDMMTIQVEETVANRGACSQDQDT